MFEGHDPYLVALSVAIAILGGYTGFGLAARIRGDAGREPPRAAGGRGGVSRRRHLDHAFRRHAGGADPGRRRLSGAAHHHLVPDLRAGGRHLAVLRQHRRADAAARGVLGGAARASASSACIMSAFMASPAISPSSMTAPMVLLSVAGRDRRGLWRPARLPGAAGRHPADRELDRLRHRRLRHALHRDARHAFRAAVGGGASPWRRARRVAANAVDRRGVLCFVIAAGFLLSLVPDPRRQIGGGRRCRRCRGARRPSRPAADAAPIAADQSRG